MKNLLKLIPQGICLFLSTVLLSALYTACDSGLPIDAVHTAIANSTNAEELVPKVANIAVSQRIQVPVLCYHQIRDWRSSDSKTAKDYIVPVNNFHEQMKFLADNGYHTILPDQLYDYLQKGTPLPSKPVMISFDDTRAEQYTIANEDLNKYGFKGVYFIMTVSLGRPGYMSSEEVRRLADEGNIIGSHTWDHNNVKKYSGNDWTIQIDRPSQQLEKITGRPIKYFAYPFGLWDREAIAQLKERGFKAAFQLSARRDDNDPLFTIRRIIVPGEWSTNTLQKSMKNSF